MRYEHEPLLTWTDVVWLGGIVLGIWLGYDVVGPMLNSFWPWH